MRQRQGKQRDGLVWGGVVWCGEGGCGEAEESVQVEGREAKKRLASDEGAMKKGR